MPLALLFPQQNACHLCGRALCHAALLCPACEARLHAERLSNPRHRLPPLAACVSLYRHQGVARDLIHLLKYGSDPSLAALLGQAMAVRRPLLGPVDAVVPVPMHPARRQKRGYNQAELLASAFCQSLELPFAPQLLSRPRAMSTQVGRTRAERLCAMRGAFDTPLPELVRGRQLLLVDDVLTTGATALACAEALLQAHATSVSLITVCRA